MSDDSADIETIVRAGAEGGAITLLGRRGTQGAWQFRLATQDSSWAVLDEDEGGGGVIRTKSDWVGTWAEAIRLLDRYAWPRLLPLEVHPDFRDDVLLEATRRLLDGDQGRARGALEHWVQMCRQAA